MNLSRKVSLVFSVVLILVSLNAKSQVAQTPPMGWNSYNCFGSAVHEDEVKANADYINKNLKEFGWQYVVVDFLWSYDNPVGSNIGNPYQKRLDDGSYIPWLSMDKWGRLLPQSNKFPSAFGGKGFKPLSDYVHNLGLKFGIHVMRGIPRQAVWSKSPVLGTNGITADMIADTNSLCPWMNHMYGLDMTKTGAQEYLNSILKLYAEWEVDFIKVDDIARPYSSAEVAGYKNAIDNSGRPMVLSLSPGETPRNQADHATQYANMWRMADDFWDNWEQTLKMFDYAKTWEGIGKPGHWPDCDMIQIGKLSKRGPVGPERFSRFTEDELYTHINFWCLYRSPLMLGGNLPENTPLELKLFTNSEVLAVNQKGENPHQVFKNDSSMVWVSQVAGNKDVYVGLFNIGNSAHEVSVDFSLLNLKGDIQIRDLWKKNDLGKFQNKFAQKINAHGSVLLRLTESDISNDSLKVTLPKEGRLINGKPIGKNWTNLLNSLAGWNIDTTAFQLTNGILHGDYYGGKFHNHAWTKKLYKDFELQAVVKMAGKDANSGVCIRLNPIDADNAPGYQVDMGAGYWGCLWEEKRAGMVQKFPEEMADKLVKDKDWNHYYVIAQGHHIQAWLNGVKTIDIIHEAGFSEGSIGFQLCHGDKHTVLDVKSLYIKELK